jgi:hypothetical protein
MAVDKFSSTLPDYTGDVANPALRDSLAFLKNILGADFRVVEWSDGQIAVPVPVPVDLPSLGNDDNIDIQVSEPVNIVFDFLDYPATAPMVFSDRTDFPKDKLAHLYVAKNGRPPAFCYVRGNSDEWYANKRIQDLVTRIGNWLRDAAAGELTEDGNQFEPLRLEGYTGTNMYDYELFADLVHQKKSFVPGQNWTMGLFERAKDKEVASYKLIKVLTLQNAGKVIEEFDAEKKKDKEAPDKKPFHYGYILWSNEDTTFSDYQIDLPKDWESFKIFCASYHIDLTSFEDMVATADGNYYLYFPVIVGIKRPSNLIGFSSNIEFVNFKFRIDTEDVGEGKIVNNIPLKFQSHNQPLTPLKAREISGSTGSFANRSVVFGCGALGSKIVTHFGRSGLTALTLIDPDHLSPHNLVRHALGADDVGTNKATGLAAFIKKMYPQTDNGSLISGPSFKDGLFDIPDTFKSYEWVFDFTASEAFFNKLVSTKSMDESQVCSVSISDFGNLGVMLKEGSNRNPRIDDLQAYLYSRYQTNNKIKTWLKREQQEAISGNIIVHVGVGCNSETTVLSDDKVSAHSAFFAGVVKHQMNKQDIQGKIVLNRISETDEYSLETETITVEPFDIIPAVNDESWSIRFKGGILEDITKASVKAKKKETGGVFIGVANYKTKTIHVTDHIPAPPDSKANSICFYRGHNGLPEQIKEVTTGSGGQLGYIGEWHSHPMGPNGLSDVDMASVNRFKIEFSELTTPLPVFLAVVAPAGILPYVY